MTHIDMIHGSNVGASVSYVRFFTSLNTQMGSVEWFFICRIFSEESANHFNYISGLEISKLER